MLYLQVYLTEVFMQVKVCLRSGQKMHFELVHFNLEGLEGKVKEIEECGEWPTWGVTSVRELLLVMSLFMKKSVMAVCLVPRLWVDPTGGVGCVSKPGG